MQFYNKWREFLTEAKKDAKVLRNINIGHLRKEIPMNPDEPRQEYEARLQHIEADPDTWNAVFPNELVAWIHILPDEYFPNDARKIFAKWLGNAVYFEETDGDSAPGSASEFQNLNRYINDIRYIVDYLNGQRDRPKDLWNLSFPQMFKLAEDYHHRLAAGLIGKEDLPSGKPDYVGKSVVFRFKNGYVIAEVNPGAGDREYTKAQGLRCGWAHDAEEKDAFEKYYRDKGTDEEDIPYFTIRDRVNDLDIEGCEMGHCVGGYCDRVTSGRLKIYSLRSPNNEPHATIEVAPSGPAGGVIGQIKGKGNAAPIEKYRPMIKQWLKTTSYDYKSSQDYLNLLTDEELKEALATGELSGHGLKKIIQSTSNSELIDYFLDIIELIEHGREHGLSGFDYMDMLAYNKNLNEEQRIKILRFNLKGHGGIAGRLNSNLIRVLIGEGDFSSRLWEEIKDEIKSPTAGLSGTALKYMTAIVTTSSSPEIKNEIIENLVTEESIDNLASQASNSTVKYEISTTFSALVSDYVNNKVNKAPHPDLARKIYRLSKTPKTMWLFTGRGIEQNLGMSFAVNDELVEEFLQDIKVRNSFINASLLAVSVLENPQVKDSKKIELAEIYLLSQDLDKPVQGLKYSIESISWARSLVNNVAPSSGPKFVKWLTHSGLLDPHFAERVKGRHSRQTGKRLDLENLTDEEKHQTLGDIHKLRQEWLGRFLDNPPPWAAGEVMLEQENTMSEVKKYFDKKDKGNKFYKEVEQSLVKEEAGRSRQRGIYKFHCMLSYGLTSEEGKTRGLDDILADMRALENVTIVTVAIRNQKVATGRYIAGLAIKFIPSVPGQFNSPEDVKARIVRDIKRLTNVQTLFKLSAGLNRLE